MRGLKALLLVTDIGFLVYWAVSLLLLAGVPAIPKAWLFKDYADPIMVAWNWSYLPMDLALSVSGLLSIRYLNAGNPRWRPLAMFSLSLTFCAGLMALAFWTLRCDFDLVWWIPNGFLLAWPWFFLPRLGRALSVPEAP